MLTLDLVQEEDTAPPAAEGQDSCEGSFRVDLDKSMALLAKRSNSDGCPATPAASEARGKSDSLPRQEGAAHTPEKLRRASLDEILICQAGARPASPTTSTSELQDLIAQKLERTREMLAEVRLAGPEGPEGTDRAEVERLLQEAASAWGQARRVLEEVRGLQELYRQLEQSPATPLSPSHTPGPKSPLLADYRKSMM